MKQLFLNNNKIWFLTFIVVAIAMFVVLPLMSIDAGNTGDEDGFQIPQGKNVVNYFKTDGQDTTCLDFKDNLQYYGSSFDVITEFINQIFHIENISTSRHICNSLLGWLAILMVGLIACQIGGFRAGVFAMALLFLSPRFLGHSFNNPKDLPFATGVISAIYGIILFFKQFPKVKWYTYLILILSVAFSISVRIGGLILFGYFGLFGLIYLIRVFIMNKKSAKCTTNCKNKTQRLSFWNHTIRMVVMGLVVCILGYFLGLILWPYALQSPIKHPIEAFQNMSAFDTGIRQIFEGKSLWSDLLPWYYTPKFILMTIPIAVIVGMVLFFVFCWRKKEDRFWSFLVFFTFFFPVFWIVYTRANVYGGWRHAMFAYPPMVVAAGLGFEGLVKWVENKVMGSGLRTQGSEGEQQSATKNWKPVLVNVGSVVLLLLLLVGPIRHIIANHPYEYVYFNELVGGTKNQLGQYEMDYYYHSTREASEWVLANAEKKKDGSKVVVATWHTASVDYFFRKDTNDFQVKFVRWSEKEYNDWDYAIFTVTGMWPDYLKSEYFPPKNTVKTIDVDGVPIAVILKREDKSDCQAYALRRNYSKVDSMILLYQKALKVDPNNPGALLGLGEAYMRIGELDSALLILNRHLKFDPELSDYSRAIVYLNKKDTNTAIDLFHKLIKSNPKDVDSYDRLLQVLLERKDLVTARKDFLKAIDADQMTGKLEKLWVKYCDLQNIGETDAYIQLYRLTAESLEKRGRKKDAKVYREALGE